MDINFDRKIISKMNRQYLVQDLLETRVSFQTKITLQFDESQTNLPDFPWVLYEALYDRGDDLK